MPTALEDHKLQEAVIGHFTETPALKTFSAFEGKVDGNTVKGVSIIQEGPALGHGVWVDKKALEQVKKLASGKGRIKAKLNHWSSLEDTVGFYENFRIKSGKVLADLSLFESHAGKAHLLEMISEMPTSFGVSIMFRGDEPEYDKENDRYNTRVKELYSADFVDTPAANRDGVFEAEIDKADEDMPTPAPSITQEAFDAYKTAQEAALAALQAEVTALKAAKPVEAPPAPEAPKPDALSALTAAVAKIQEDITTAFKVQLAAPGSKQEPAPANEQEQPEPPKAFSVARAEAIGDATGLSRISKARAFDASYPSEAAYLASFKK